VPRILVVDEDETQSYFFTYILEAAGFGVMSARSLASAVDILDKDSAFDAAFVNSIDLNERDMHQMPVPIIVFQVGKLKPLANIEQHVIGYIQYPVHPKELAEQIRAILNKHVGE
jgi:DNA-binding response OmpR family regulator